MPPSAPTAYTIKSTLIMSIWCTSYAIAINLYRCGGRWRRTERIWIEDVIILLSILILVARMVLANIVLKYGTNNVDAASLAGEADIRRRVIGSQLVLICRLLYLTFLWMIKLSGGIYIARLTDQFWASKSLTSKTSSGRALKAFLSNHLNRIFYTFLALSYIAVVLSEAAECRPFHHYWQVTPTPELSCRVAPGNLFTMGVLHIATDLTLVALPLPMIISAKLPIRIKLETFLLMLFPLVNVAFTCFRLPFIRFNHGAQRYRTLLASVDILLSTASANALVVISFLKDRGYKKLKYRHREGEEDDDDDDDGATDEGGVISSGVELESLDNNKITGSPFGNHRKSMLPSPRRPTWGSDEDLMRDDSDGGPSTHTTSAKDAESGEAVEVLDGQDGMIIVRNDTSHLSPDLKAETSIVAARRVEAQGRTRSLTVPSSPPPCHTSLQSGIVVETSWKVDVSHR